MKRNLIWTVLFSGLVITYLTFNQKSNISEDKNSKDQIERGIPIPTQVNNKMANEEEYENRKEMYIEMIHSNGQDIDWRAINAANFAERSEWVQQMKAAKVQLQYANGEIAGEWFERGATDQAGNVRTTAFDEQSEAVYAISDGGILWKGDINGSSWESLNDHVLFAPHVLQTIRLADGTLRILATTGRIITYSDDEGQTWTNAIGFSGPNGGRGVDLYQLNDNDSTILYLYQDVSWTGSASSKLAISTDHGASFNILQNMQENSGDRVSMSWPLGSSIAYILDGQNDLYRFEGGAMIPVASGLSMGGNFETQIEAVITTTDTILYALMNHDDLWKSTNAGQSFSNVGPLPTNTWDCGFGVSIDNPDVLFYGEVNIYQSLDGGQNWHEQHYWGDYYSDVVNNIHADIMEFENYKKSDGTIFNLICNHGGINISYDGLTTTTNVGLLDLNVSQSYDVATSPFNSAFIFSGTQDQGLQRASNGTATTPVAFEQVISGDYGQQQFCNNGQSFWTQYPGADFSYYADPLTANWSDYWFDIDGNDMPNVNWIVPTGSSPDPADDWILVGGGSADGGSGSYLIKLENLGTTAQATNFPFDFLADAGEPIGAIETTPLNYDKWYVVTENGHFYHSEDAGQTWTASQTTPGSNWIWSADIYASRLTEGLVFVGGTNYVGKNVYMSTDGGQTFTGIDNGMPNTMCHELCMDAEERFLFAATDAGPYMYSMMQDEWFYLAGTEAPIQNYVSVEFVENENVVRYATYGRGIWDFKIADLASIEDEALENASMNPYPNPSANGIFNINAAEYSLVKIVDMQGKVVAETPLLPGLNPLNLSFLKAGSYLMVGTDGHGRVIREKLIVR